MSDVQVSPARRCDIDGGLTTFRAYTHSRCI